jgi:hypothetical protein
MANKYRIRAFRAAVESAYGVDAVPGAADALLVAGDFTITPNIETASRDIIRPFLGNAEQFPVASSFGLSGSVELAGSGTQGTAPAWGKLLMACGFAETTVAGLATIQTSPPTASGTPAGSFTYDKTTAFTGTLPRSVTLTCTTAGASGVAKFTVSAPATPADPAYNQLGVTMTNATAFALPNSATITPTVVAPFAVGDTFTINLMPPHVYFTPVSNAFTSLSCYAHMSLKNHKLLGMMGNANISMDAKAIPKIKFDFTALYGAIADEAVPPTVNLAAWKKPVAVNNINTAMPNLQGHAAPMYAFSLDVGNKVGYVNLPGQEFVTIQDRASKGSITIIDPSLASWDYYAAVRNVIQGGLDVIHGTVPGNIVEIQSGNAQVSKPTYEDKNGDVALKMDLAFLPSTAGNDEIKILVY